MLVEKGKFKYSEDLEGRRHVGTGADDKLYILLKSVLALLETSLIQGQQRENIPIHSPPVIMATQSDSPCQLTGKMQPQSLPTHPGGHCYPPELGREENASAFQDLLLFFLLTELQAGFLGKNIVSFLFEKKKKKHSEKKMK